MEAKGKSISPFRVASGRRSPRGVHSGAERPLIWTAGWQYVILGALLFITFGCAKYNTYFNAKKSFDNAEHVRDEAIKKHQDPPKPAGTQKSDYDTAIRKAQKILDEYPGHSLTDDALFLQAKAYHRLESYRMSIRKFDLLFTNFPQTPYMEESLYLMGLNYLLIGALDRSQEYLDRLARLYPESRYQAETMKVSGDNAFALEEWETAVKSYRAYLALDTDIEERDRIGLKLAQSYWELKDYHAAADILQEVSNRTSSADLGFRARVLRARVHVRIGDFELAEVLLKELEAEARIYNAQGEVLLIQAESLVAQGKGDEASPLLENMPTEWETPAVKARAAEILGYLYMERGEWELARPMFQTALLKKDELEDEEKTRLISENLQAYMAADNALPDAPPERVPTLRLLQANAMLFGFEHPEEAARLYALAAADTAADSTVAARALYGAFLTHDRYLDQPDSAAVFASRLEEDYPGSPQAYEIRSGQDSNLLGYLLDIRTQEQEERYANLSEEERAALNEIGEGVGTDLTARGPKSGVRRRMIYLSRRSNLVFEPSEEAFLAASRRDAAKQARATGQVSRTAAADSSRAPVGAVLPGGAAGPPGTSEVLPDTAAVAPDQSGPEAASKLDEAEAAAEEAAKEEAAKEKEAKEKEEKERDKNWDFLR